MIKVQWTEAEESPTWETLICVDSYKEALQYLVEYVNGRGAIAEFFRIIETGISVENRYGRKLDKVKPLVQYLDEYLEHETAILNIDADITGVYNSWSQLLQQAFDAYESTEQVKIKIERV